MDTMIWLATLLCHLSYFKLAVQSKVGLQRLAQLGYTSWRSGTCGNQTRPCCLKTRDLRFMYKMGSRRQYLT